MRCLLLFVSDPLYVNDGRRYTLYGEHTLYSDIGIGINEAFGMENRGGGESRWGQSLGRGLS